MLAGRALLLRAELPLLPSYYRHECARRNNKVALFATMTTNENGDDTSTQTLAEDEYHTHQTRLLSIILLMCVETKIWLIPAMLSAIFVMLL